MRSTRIHLPTAGVITIALATATALTISLAPVAAADPAPLPHPAAPIAATHGSAPVRPNPDEQTMAGAKASTGPCSEVCSGGGYGSVPATVVHVTVPDNSFRWSDAAIGAGAVLALLGLGLAGTRAATSRKRHAREERALATN